MLCVRRSQLVPSLQAWSVAFLGFLSSGVLQLQADDARGLGGTLSPGKASVDRTIQSEYVRRQNLVVSSQKALNEGASLYNAGEFRSAAERYRWVLENLPLTEQTRPLYVSAASGLVSCNIALAKDAVKRNDWEAAKSFAVEGLTYAPRNGTLLEILHDAEVALGEKIDVPIWEQNTAVTPEFIRAIEEVQNLLYEGDQFRDTGQYLVAERRYNQALVIDPYNATARKGLERVAQLKLKYAKVAHRQGREEMLYDVTKSWSNSEKRLILKGANQDAALPANITNIAQMTEKLNSIILDRVDFSDSSIEEAIDVLRRKSKELDPEGRGVNFVVKTAVLPPATAPGAAPVEAAAAPAGPRTITLNLENLSLAAVLDLVVRQADMNYKIQEFAVFVAPVSDNLETLFTREFKVPPGFITTTIQVSAGNSAAAGENVKIVTEEVKKKLESFGVEFPSGATANYLPSGSRLVVRNTESALDLIEEALAQENTVAPQVQIETRFMEINQSDLDELSFRWNVNQRRRGQSTATDTPGLRTSVPANIVEGQVPNELTVGNGAITVNSLDSLLSAAANILAGPIGSTLQHAVTIGKYKFEGLIYALSQKTGSDVIAVPKVVTKSGSEAEIKIIREFYFPEEYDEPEIDDNLTQLPSGNFVRLVTPSTPTSFETEEIGVVLTVNPQVGPDNLTIDLTLVPKLIDFEGFINYGSPISSVDLTTGETFLITDNTINKPVFNVRQVETKVQVSDGQTVLLGGLIREDVQKIDDKIPLFGDIPGIGRLFRSKVDQSIKKNLLIFVTCNLVRPDGELFNKRGIEDDQSFDNWPEFSPVARLQQGYGPVQEVRGDKELYAEGDGKGGMK